MNRLSGERSPYLLQHKANPVDWYPWGEEAFARAREENKPIFLSIGYSTCHWCHVMEHESFEDPDVALVMNHNFVCVKVDREERPDVDAIYMDAVQAMTGSGGWPLNAFLTPDGVPFFCGTYFPPEPRNGMPSWKDLLVGVFNAWTSQRGEIDQAAEMNIARLQGARFLEAPADAEVDDTVFSRAVMGLRRQFDDEHGGWGGAPKFPATSVIEFLLARDERAMPLQTSADGVRRHLHQSAAARPSTLSTLLARPRTREVLNDNALLARAYRTSRSPSKGCPGVVRGYSRRAMRALRQDEGGCGLPGCRQRWRPSQFLR